MTLSSMMNSVRDYAKEDVLGYMGLQVKRTPTEKILGALAFFGAGLVVGVGTALLLTPKSGPEVRKAITDAVPFGHGNGNATSRYNGKEGFPTT